MKKLLLLLTTIGMVAHATAQLKGTTKPITFTGPVTNKSITFTIYLPPTYETNTDKKYPVVYHLHGVNGTHDGNQITTVPAAFEQAKDSGYWDEAIIVFPDGYVNSMWSDSYDGKKPAETNVIKEIIPYVDSNYRTISNKDNRLIEGFSMGGYGAIKLYAKYPNLFCKVVSYDGALHNWTTLSKAHPDITLEIFDNDSTLYNSEASPWTFLQQNDSLLKLDTLIYMAVGALKPYNTTMDNYLKNLGIPHEYIITGCVHVLSCLVDAEGMNAAKFETECLKEKQDTNTVSDSTVSNNLLNEDVYLFPNPTNQLLNISSDNTISSITCSNLLGEIVLEKICNAQNVIVDISFLSKGVYFMNLEMKNKSYITRKILIE